MHSKLLAELDYENIQEMIGVELDDEELAVLSELQRQKASLQIKLAARHAQRRCKSISRTCPETTRFSPRRKTATRRLRSLGMSDFPARWSQGYAVKNSGRSTPDPIKAIRDSTQTCDMVAPA
jgi:hypothetical protein